MQAFNLKTAVHFGAGALDCLKSLAGEQAFIVTDAMMEKLGFVDQVVSMLQEVGFSSTTFTDVTPDPDIKMVTAGLEKMVVNLPDIVVAIGGGSVIDTAKGILYSYGKKIGRAHV